MNKHKTESKEYAIPMSLGMAGIIFGAMSEIAAIWEVEQNWPRLLSSTGLLAIGLYLLLLLAGLFLFAMGLWHGERLSLLAHRLRTALPVRGLIVTGLLLAYTYIYLFSVWQPILFMPWTQLLFAISLAQLLLFIIAPEREQHFGWSELALALGIFLYPRVIQEMRELFINAIVYRAATAAGFGVLLSLIFVLYFPYGETIRQRLVVWRERLGWPRFLLIVLLCFVPMLHRYLVKPETYIVYDDIRFMILILAVWLAAYFGLRGSSRLVSPESLGLSLGTLVLVAFLARSSLLILDYPFSLSWSEGNRFYDYSLVFGQSLYSYPGHIVNPYSSPGRYGLWGVLFLWPGLPVWVHRLWNIILLTVPVLLFAALITRKLRPAFLRYGALLWITLFLTVLAPLHPPFVIASAIAVCFAFDESLLKRGSSLAAASFYAGLSRWTWAVAPTAIGVIIDLILYYPRRIGPLWRRLFPSMVLAAVSLIAGLLPSIRQYFSLVQGEALSSGQPLLWYRLFPNDTLGPGVLFLVLRYTLPILIILISWMIFHRWQLDWVQRLAVLGALTGFFVIGLVISTKIGGGGDLHNLDMFLITLIVVTVLALMSVDVTSFQGNGSGWLSALVCFLIFWVVYPFLPLHPGSNSHAWLSLPNQNRVAEAFSTVSREVAKFAKSGEVLFMDHRQLLTFGYLPAVPFVPEYEKKYMMDQAMANNEAYFQPYYQDLAKKRFALIVTEPLRTKRREELGGPFSEENDAWVAWVSNPTLCFYEPIYRATDVNVELLVPKQNPVGCEEYLN